MTIRFAPVTPAAKRLNSWALPLGAPKPYPCGEQLDYEPTAEDLADWNAWLDRDLVSA